MNAIGPNTTADLFFQITWSSIDVQHTDTYAGHQVNFWRDLMPGRVYEELQGKKTGDLVKLELGADQLIQAAARQDLQTIARHQFDAQRVDKPLLEPRAGRFYPKGMLKDMAGIFTTNMDPFRCVGIRNGHLQIDLGHPLSDKTVGLNVTVGVVRPKPEERGGSLRCWGEIITQAVGMQARWQNQPTDFSGDGAYERLDADQDAVFYAKPRLIQHIDDTAIDVVRQIHSRFIYDDMSVLDLMSSWQTHLPDGITLKQLTGLGMNETELQQNPLLSDYLVHDLNTDPVLPLECNRYDAVLCSVSIEYLVNPTAVFSEVARVLKPGGTFAVTFSNRWFEPKTIRLWTELHEFERMGLVLEYFRHDHLFEDLHTYSVRGLSRPGNDKYYGRQPYSDPVYAVWGKRR